jgi:hypothetical protein
MLRTVLVMNSGVGHDQGGSVAQLDLGCTHVDALDVALGGAEHHPVAHFHRSLGQKDQARDEVLHDGLQPEADAHRERACDPRDAVHAEAQSRERHADHHDGVVSKTGTSWHLPNCAVE